MARKRFSDEDCLRILWQVELDLAGGSDVAKAYKQYIREDHFSGCRPPRARKPRGALMCVFVGFGCGEVLRPLPNSISMHFN